MNDYVTAINAASHSASQQNKLLEKLMYLMWYEHYDMGSRGIYKHMNYELLANKYYEEFGEKIKCWDVPTRGIGEFV